MALYVIVHMVTCHSGYATFYSTVYERSRVSHVYAHIPIRTYTRDCSPANMPVAQMHACTDLRACIASCFHERMSALLFCNVLVSDFATRTRAEGQRNGPPQSPPHVGMTQIRTTVTTMDDTRD